MVINPDRFCKRAFCLDETPVCRLLRGPLQSFEYHLRWATKQAGVARLVLTSSLAAIECGNDEGTLSESTWSRAEVYDSAEKLGKTQWATHYTCAAACASTRSSVRATTRAAPF